MQSTSVRRLVENNLSENNLLCRSIKKNLTCVTWSLDFSLEIIKEQEQLNILSNSS